MKLIANLAHIDRQTTEVVGIPSLLLMEEAGRRSAEAVKECLTDPDNQTVVIVSGPGNNGGDGYACARRLLMEGVENITVLHIPNPSELKGDALINFNALKNLPISLVPAVEMSKASQILDKADVIVDALFGSGLSRDIEGLAGHLVGLMNQPGIFRPRKIVAIDTPSGVDAKNGQIRGTAVKADVTVTLAAAKPGLYLYPGKAFCGDIRVVDIGTPKWLFEVDNSLYYLTSKETIKEWFPPRWDNSHKYTFGSLLVVAGSRNMPGAAALTAAAAMASGAGLVTLAAPQSVFDRVTLPPEVIHFPLPETPEGTLGKAAADIIGKVLNRFSALAVGPGIGAGNEVVHFIGNLFARLDDYARPVVMDADALNCLSRLTDMSNSDDFPKLPELSPMVYDQFILTPHIGECMRLTGMERESIEADLPKAASSAQGIFPGNIVLKSASTVIATSDGRIWINPTGNSGMATAGSGDVLTGLIAGLVAQGMKPEFAAPAGVYLHGLAGDFAAQKLSKYAMRASDITACFGDAFKQVLN